MKKILIPVTILLAVALTACGGGATASDAEVQTRVASILTTYPSDTPAPTVVPTNPLPTVAIDTPEPTGTETLEPTATEELPTPTETVAPTITETPGPSPTPTNTLAPTPTSPAGDPRTTLGTPVWTDPMDNGNSWGTGVSEFTSLDFKDGNLVLKGLTAKYGWRLSTIGKLGRSYVELSGQMVTCSGSDTYGIMFRVPVMADANRGYLFGITCDGKYYLRAWDALENPSAGGTMTTIVAPKESTAILVGAGQVNRLGVSMDGTNFKLYINGYMVHEITDSRFGDGYFGVFTRAVSTTNMEVRISEMAYWNLK